MECDLPFVASYTGHSDKKLTELYGKIIFIRLKFPSKLISGR